MTTTETFTQLDSTASRIDRLTGQVAVSAVSVGPDMADALITDALRRVCELLGADVGTLGDLSEDAINPVSRQSWVRHAAAVGLEPALAIRVPVRAGRLRAVNRHDGGGSPWSGAVADSLRALAHVMVLIVLRAQQARVSSVSD